MDKQQQQQPKCASLSSKQMVKEATAAPKAVVKRSIMDTGKGETCAVLLLGEEASSSEGEERIITVQPNTDPLLMIVFLATMNKLF